MKVINEILKVTADMHPPGRESFGNGQIESRAESQHIEDGT